MGAWIEIILMVMNFVETEVAPLVGAWIEISCRLNYMTYGGSLLSWERGLKYKYICKYVDDMCRSSRGSVD